MSKISIPPSALAKLTLACVSIALAACGGGGSSNSTTGAVSDSSDATALSSSSSHASTSNSNGNGKNSASTSTSTQNPTSTSTSTPPTTSTSTSASSAIFSPTSFWYQQIPSNAPLHANSAAFVTEFQRQINAYYGTVGINTTSYASPVYRPDASTPTVKVSVWDCQNQGYVDSGLAAQWAAVPVPTWAAQADGTDGEMTIYQPSSDTIWEFWQARKVNGQWQACWGGKMANASQSNGQWPLPYGTTATGLPFLGGQITAEELQAGVINHAIGIALVDLKSSTFSWPANRSDGSYTGSNAIAEGQRFFLDQSVNVDALNIHPIAKIIAKAAQKYGFVIWDKAGAISLRFQNPKSYTQLGQADPYPALFNGTPDYAILNGFPWDKLKFLPMDYGKQ